MITIKEAAKKYAIRNGVAGWNFDSFKAGVDFAQKWISVNEELPNLSGNYLCIVNDIFTIAFFTTNNKWIIYKTGQIAEDITYRKLTHWRPIEYL